MLSPVEITNMRLHNQQISNQKFKTIKELVAHMGAMQAQDYPMLKWAVGSRFSDATINLVEKAISDGQIIRTHLLRPTWHLVSADDIYWILDLTAPQIKSGSKSRHKDLGLTEKAIEKSNKVIENALTKSKFLTREELVAELEKANIPTKENNRAAHLLLCAELDGLICSGKDIGNKQSYALLRDRVPQTNKIGRDEAIRKLAGRYFTSHGPASIEDFIWWSGLPVKDARDGLEMVKSKLVSNNYGTTTYWHSKGLKYPETDQTHVYLIPAYDEYVISYKDRSAILINGQQSRAISSNGIFRPVIIINGQVTGLWKRTIKKDRLIIETELFRTHNKTEKKLINEAAEKLGIFLGKTVEVK